MTDHFLNQEGHLVFPFHFKKIIFPVLYYLWEGDQETEGWGKEKQGRGCKKELISVMYMYQLPAMNIIIMYCRHILI